MQNKYYVFYVILLRTIAFFQILYFIIISIIFVYLMNEYFLFLNLFIRV